MRKLLFALAAAVCVPAAVWPAAPPEPLPVSNAGFETAPLTFPDRKKILVELAATPAQREYGLMNRTKLPRDFGMLFVFAGESPLQFWMKNTWVDLDMVFIGADKRITEVHRAVPRSFPDTPDDKLARRSGRAQFVLELPSGAARRHRLKKGQTLAFDVTIPAS